MTRQYIADSLGVYNVKDFGAKGDGTTNDTAAFVAAWAAATNGSTIYVPSGTYLVNPPAGLVLSSLSDVTVYGQGTIKATGKPTLGSPVGTNRTVLVEFISCTRVTVSGLTFDMNSIASGAVGLQACTDSVVEGCEVYGSGGVTAGEYALIACAGSHNTFRNNYIHDDVAGSTSHAIGWGGVTSQVGQDETYGQIIGNRCDTLDATAIVLTGTHCVATGNVCVNNRTGGGIISACTLTNDNRAENHVITGNYCARNNFHGYQTDCWPITPGPSGIARNITVSGNTFVNCKSGGMLINAAEDVTITGNTIINDDPAYAITGNAGITLNQASEDLRRVLIADNVIRFTATGMAAAYGIKMQGTQNVTYLFEDITIRGNQISLNKTAGYRGFHLLDAFDGQVYNRVSIEHNNIRSCDYGVFVHSDYANGQMNNLQVVGNRVTDVLTNAFYFRAEDTTNIQDAVVTGNQTDGTLYSGSQSGNVRFVRNYGNSWNAGLVDGVFNVKDFGAKGDGTTDDTASITSALAALTDGASLYFPPGTYVWRHGDGSIPAANITKNRITIFGAGRASAIVGYRDNGTLPDNPGNENYRVFHADSKSGITIKDLSFSGYTTPIRLDACTGCVVSGIYDDGQLANAGKFMRDKTIYIDESHDVKITDSTFLNFRFAVHIGQNPPSVPSTRVVVSNCSFEHTTTAGNYDADYPVGVYWYYANDCVVTGCTFKNIYSDVDNGTTGTGMGYGIYEGDGTGLKSGVISNNVFVFEPKQGVGGDKRAYGIYTNHIGSLAITGNSFWALSSGGNQAAMMRAIRLQHKTQDAKYTITGNTIYADDLNDEKYGIHVYDPGPTPYGYSASITISGNTIVGMAQAIRLDGVPDDVITISGNTIRNTTLDGIYCLGLAGYPNKNISIVGNTITGTGLRGITFDSYTVSPRVIGNTILDGNTTAAAGDAGAAILFSSYSYGSYIANNVIGNTLHGGGGFTYGITNAANVTGRMFKDILSNNSFVGLGNGTTYGTGSRHWNRTTHATGPTAGIVDIVKGDLVLNTIQEAAQTTGWYCVFKSAQAITADASSAIDSGTGVSVASTASMANGDIVILLKNANPYDSDYYTATEYHITTISSVDSGTDLTLTDAIPAGDGTYSNGTAVLHVARFKAAPALP